MFGSEKRQWRREEEAELVRMQSLEIAQLTSANQVMVRIYTDDMNGKSDMSPKDTALMDVNKILRELDRFEALTKEQYQTKLRRAAIQLRLTTWQPSLPLSSREIDINRRILELSQNWKSQGVKHSLQSLLDQLPRYRMLCRAELERRAQVEREAQQVREAEQRRVVEAARQAEAQRQQEATHVAREAETRRLAEVQRQQATQRATQEAETRRLAAIEAAKTPQERQIDQLIATNQALLDEMHRLREEVAGLREGQQVQMEQAGYETARREAHYWANRRGRK